METGTLETIDTLWDIGAEERVLDDEISVNDSLEEATEFIDSNSDVD